MRAESLLLIASAWFALMFNGAWWNAVLADKVMNTAGHWAYAAGVFTILVAAQFIVMGVLIPRRIVKPALLLLTLVAAGAAFYIDHYGVIIDADMMRNVFVTSRAEAGELISTGLMLNLVLHVGLVALLLRRVEVVPATSRLRGTLARAGALFIALLLGVGALLAVFQDFSGLMRNHKGIRYLITPANVVYASARATVRQSRQQAAARLPVGEDARLGASWKRADKPMLFVVVVGETARAANWGLNGYARDTTPQLAARDVINFSDVTSCGTNTETSVPCMFSQTGRRDYDEDRIRGTDSLLHVLARAGLDVRWVDNQSGCKGVCADLPTEHTVRSADQPGCDGQFCQDDVLLEKLKTLAAAPGSHVAVLHQLGNHGPAYARRHPPAFRRFSPTCDSGELHRCDTASIINSYDNALLYTDDVLGRTIDFLKAQSETYDTALLYVSDHGESLGENGLFLHGIPYAIAPDAQKKVPMVAWFSDGFSRRASLDPACLRAGADAPLSHDNLFHSLLGLLDVDTRARDAAFDFTAACRGA